MAAAEELETKLDQAETDVAKIVLTVLAEIAAEFADDLADATEIVAARFSVSRIAGMWASRMPRIVRRLLRVAETAATDTADTVEMPLPEGWDDLPGRHEDGRELPPGIGEYVQVTEHLLRAVGDRLADVAVRELAAGVEAEESVDELRDRLLAAFRREGAQLGTAREQRIARTEAGRAWNTATLAAAQALTGPDRPLVKQWQTRRDTSVRDAHDKVDGQLRFLDEPFTVAGVEMSAPLDPTAPPALTVNCRCILRVQAADRDVVATWEGFPHLTGRDPFGSQTTAGSPVKNPRKESIVSDHVTAAADGSHLSGAMIALIPTAEDAERLAIEGGEAVEELHLTLYFLGAGADWSEDQRTELIDNVRTKVQEHGLADDLVYGRAFGANHWNAGSDEPSWVWSVGDDRDRPDDAPTLQSAHWAATYALEDRHGPDIPAQHTPWAAHVCAAYSDDPGLLPELEARLGPVTFDRIRVAFAGEHTDIPLGPQEEPMEPDTDTTADGMPIRSWSNPDDTALAFENEETGDGRLFVAGSVYWEDTSMPLQYADEMLMGHQGAELVGAIETASRDSNRITGSGVLYTSRPAGKDVESLLEEEAPLGVSVDLDDVDVEFVTSPAPEGEGEDFAVMTASLPAASVMQLPDGAWRINASTVGRWTASGTTMSQARHSVQLITGPGGRVSAAAAEQAFGLVGGLRNTGKRDGVKAAAGDPDDPDGIVIHSERAGDFIMRITRARLRGATLVAMPAYSRARIVLDPVEDEDADRAASMRQVAALIASSPGDDHWRVVGYVSSSPAAVSVREVARALGITMQTARGHLTRAAEAGRLVHLGDGLYVGVSSLPEGAEATAAALPAEDEDQGLQELVASAWAAMQDLPPMPAAWFKEPTAEELPPGSGGVHYAKGRVYGWVAQRGVPHAGYPGKNLTIESLGDLDFSHFLRQRFVLDDGTYVKVGAFTMGVGHHRDGAQCETAACQFDDSGTVGAIVTVGMNDGGLWFSGASAPWLSEWDALTFQTCQPSYHLRQGPGGRYELRAVLSVPVPGHSSPLLASVVERSNLALAASAARQDTLPGHLDTASAHASAPVSGRLVSTPADLPGQRPDTVSATSPDTAGQGELVEAVAALLTSPAFLDRFAGAMERREAEHAANRAEVERLAASLAPARQEVAAGLAGTVEKGAA
ncbi:phage minor head protein [Streptomyces sp. NPDC007346]|uniref:phage minor head protein n=1 Tax=Streptomyces sp. NPDC007346 TaxID=3154682 RepID=UPI003455BDBC